MSERMCRSIQTELLQDRFQLPLDEVVGVQATTFDNWSLLLSRSCVARRKPLLQEPHRRNPASDLVVDLSASPPRGIRGSNLWETYNDSEMKSDPHAVQISVDASCYPNQGRKSGYAGIVVYPDQDVQQEVLFQGFQKSTINRMELSAALPPWSGYR